MAIGLKNLRRLAELSPRTKVIIVSAIVVAIAVFQEFNENFQIPAPNLLDLKVLLLGLPTFLIEQYQVVAASLAIGIAIIFLMLKWPARKRTEKVITDMPAKEISNADTKKALKVIDSLLEKLPDKEFKKFSRTSEAVLYKRVMKKFGVR